MADDQLLFFALRYYQWELNGAPVSPEIATILNGMQTLLSDAVISLLGFDDATQRQMDRIRASATAAGSERREERIMRIDLDEPMFEREHREVLRDWNEGRVPNVFLDRLSWIYAKAFVYATFGIGRFLQILSKKDGAPIELGQIVADFDRDFPGITDLRDSAQHVEDRWRGYTRQRLITPVAQTIQEVTLEGSTDSLINRTYTTLLPDGTQGALDVSQANVAKLRDRIQAAYNVFAGSKPPGLFPHFEV